MLRFRQLRAALATASAGSVSGAAREVHTTQPALTSAISSLEKTLGAPVFSRSAQGMELTPVGKAFVERVRAAVAHLDGFERSFGSRRKSRTPFHRLVSESQLQAYLALCEQGSFVAAARYLGVTQPAISRNMRDLEALAGISLWRRTGTSGEPTPEGRELVRAIGVCFRDIELATDAFREHHGRVDGTLRIGALPLSRSDWVPNAVIETLKPFPQARISLLDGPYVEQLNALNHGRVDLIVGALRPESQVENVHQVAVFEDTLSIVVRPGHPALDAATNGATDRDWLAQQTWILSAPGTPGRERFLAYLETLGLSEPHHVIESGSLIATRALLRASDFAAPLSRRQIRLELDAGLLAIVAADLPATRRSIGITMRQGFQPTKLYGHLIDALTRTGTLI